jgi:ADP-L-glycero-D-manno-heptose 6-epimerase
MVWLYQNKNVNGLFNVGSGKARSFRDLAEAAFRAAGKPSKITYIDMPETLALKYQYYTQADVTSLREAGYTKPFTELEEGVRQYIQEYMSSSDPYR